jgi:hypothetical protein
MTGIYVASRVVRAPLWRKFRDVMGFPIISTWIDEDGEGQTADFGELWVRVRGEIQGCKALVFYAHDMTDFPFKGALVEVGMALAFDKPVFVCINDVMLDGRTLRPLGSWALDRHVTMCDTLEQALDIATAIAPSETDMECP